MGRIGIARVAVAAGLVAAMAATPAYAGTVTCASSDGTTHEYQAYRVLDGEFSEDGGAIARVSYDDGFDADWWASLGAPDTSAQDVADWLVGSASDDVATRAARAVGEREPDAAFRSGEEAELADGYWLVVGADSQPVLVPVGASTRATLSEKSTVPTDDKEVWDGDSWEKAADWGAQDGYQYRLTGTLPSNYAQFDRYHYEFVDEMDSCIAPDASSVVAVVEHADGTTEELGGFEAGLGAVEGQVGRSRLTVRWDDLKGAYPEARDGDLIRVTYDARLTVGAKVGAGAPNENDVRLRYTRSPTNDQVGEAKPARCEVYAWLMTMTKVSAGDRRPLAGAAFAISRDGRWLCRDGTWADSRDAGDATFVTDEDGRLQIPPVDEGTYELVEVSAPDGYALEPDATTLTLDSSDLAGTPRLDASADGPARLLSVDASTGTAALELEDEAVPEAPTPQSVLRQVVTSMPQTGVGVAGTGLLAAGIAVTTAALRRGHGEDDGKGEEERGTEDGRDED